MSLESILNASTVESLSAGTIVHPSATDQSPATKQLNSFSGPLGRERPFGEQPGLSPFTAQVNAPRLFGKRQDQAPRIIPFGENLPSSVPIAFRALAKITQPLDRNLENDHIANGKIQAFIRGDALKYFLDTWEVTLAGWMTLLHKTTPPEGDTFTAQQMGKAVDALESVITGQELLPTRFGYLQLANFLDALETRVQFEKDKAVECSAKSPTTIAFDQYLTAQGRQQWTKNDRAALSHKRWIGRRWQKLASPSSLLLLAFSDDAEAFVKRGSKNLSQHSLKDFATKIFKVFPENLLNTCIYISGAAEMAVRVGNGWDIPRVKDFRYHVSKLS